jgi:hypothetical protein
MDYRIHDLFGNGIDVTKSPMARDRAGRAITAVTKGSHDCFKSESVVLSFMLF